MRKVFWLASYPKSGNTWMRVFLSNYMLDGDEPASINNLETDGISSARHIFDEFAGIEASEMDLDTVDRYRPDVYRLYAAEQEKERLFIKVHDMYHTNMDGEPLFPADISRGAIYMVRNPLDVAVSFAFHNGATFEKTVRNLNDPEYAFHDRKGHIRSQLRQKMGSWSDHYRSWSEQKEIPILVVRYEDMKDQPEDTFSRVVKFCGWDLDKERLQKTLRFSSIDVLQEQEQEQGFHEKSPAPSPFFRSGRSGEWREHLSELQAAEIVDQHWALMVECGYLSEHTGP